MLLFSLQGSFQLCFVGGVNNSTWFVQNFLDLNTKNPRSPEPSQSWANQDGWSPSWWPLSPAEMRCALFPSGSEDERESA